VFRTTQNAPRSCLFTTRSLRSLEAQRTQSFLSFTGAGDDAPVKPLSPVGVLFPGWPSYVTRMPPGSRAISYSTAQPSSPPKVAEPLFACRRLPASENRLFSVPSVSLTTRSLAKGSGWLANCFSVLDSCLEEEFLRTFFQANNRKRLLREGGKPLPYDSVKRVQAKKWVDICQSL
jgi:hypothetical protein